MSRGTVVVFDLDDTLYPERDFLHSGWRAVACSSGLEPDRAYAVMSSADDAFDALHELVPDFSIAAMLGIYRNHIPKISLDEKVGYLLEQLRSAGVGIGIITDGRSATQRNKLSALGLERYVDYVSVSEEIGADKLTRVPFDKAMEFFGPESHFIYFGDNPAKDFLWPNRLGWHTVMLREPYPGRNIHPQDTAVLDTSFLPKVSVDTLDGVLALI